jgi:hypothetical protein
VAEFQNHSSVWRKQTVGVREYCTIRLEAVAASVQCAERIEAVNLRLK